MNLTKSETLGLNHLVASVITAEQERQRISCALSAIQGPCYELADALRVAEMRVRTTRDALNANFGTSL